MYSGKFKSSFVLYRKFNSIIKLWEAYLKISCHMSVSTALPDVSRDWFWPWHWHSHWWSHFYFRSLELPAVEAASTSSPAPTAGPSGLGNSPEHAGGTGHLAGMHPAQPRDPSAQRRSSLPRYLQLPVPPGAPEVPGKALPEHGQTKMVQRHRRGWDVSILKCVSHASFILCITLKNAHARSSSRNILLTY